MKQPIRAYDFLKTFDQDTAILVKNPQENQPDDLREWEDDILYRRTVLSASIGILHGKVVVCIYVSTDDTGPKLFPSS